MFYKPFNLIVMRNLFTALFVAFMVAACNDSAKSVVVVPEGVHQKIEVLNAELAVRCALAQAVSTSSVSTVVQTGDIAEVAFGNGVKLSLKCVGEVSAQPFIGTKADGATEYWTVGADGEWLADASGERMEVAKVLPVAGVDAEGYWTVQTDNARPWRVSVGGRAVVASGDESVAQFKSVSVESGKVVIAFTDATYINADVTTDLSAAATANCYVVSAAGRYAFKASVRGNGVGDVATCGYDAQIALDDMRADWLWTTAEGLISDVAYDKQSGEITFVAADGKRGNALIVLMKESVVVWSWHIWLTDEPQTMTYANGVVFQDRNLGATSAEAGSTDAYGLYYQWGRKEPFVGGVTTETSATAFAEAAKGTIVNPALAERVWSGVTGTLTTSDDAAANPMSFIYNKIGATSIYNWLARPKATLWGVDKTLNDPCPAGYKVPEIESWDDLSSGNRYIDGVSEWDGVKYGMTYTYGGKTAWYPAQGSRNKTAGNLIGLGTTRSGNYWASETTSQSSRFFYFQKKLSSSSGEINSSLDKDRSSGYSVRCCKE